MKDEDDSKSKLSGMMGKSSILSGIKRKPAVGVGSMGKMSGVGSSTKK